MVGGTIIQPPASLLLLIHCGLFEDSRGNCVKFETIPILHASSYKLSPENAINLSCSRARQNLSANECSENLSDELVFLNSVIDHNYPFDVEKLTLTCRLIVAHIAGFIVRKLEEKLSCESCINALKETKPKKRTMLLFN